MSAEKYYAKENKRWCVLIECNRPQMRSIRDFAESSVLEYASYFRVSKFACPLIVFTTREDRMSMADKSTIWLDADAGWLEVCHELAHTLYMQHTGKETGVQHNYRHRQITDWLCSRLFRKGYLDENFNI